MKMKFILLFYIVLKGCITFAQNDTLDFINTKIVINGNGLVITNNELNKEKTHSFIFQDVPVLTLKSFKDSSCQKVLLLDREKEMICSLQLNESYLFQGFTMSPKEQVSNGYSFTIDSTLRRYTLLYKVNNNENLKFEFRINNKKILWEYDFYYYINDSLIFDDFFFHVPNDEYSLITRFANYSVVESRSENDEKITEKWYNAGKILFFKSYYSNGKVKEQGSVNGVYEVAYPDGLRVPEMLKTGTWQYYSEDGVLQKKESWLNGEKIE